MPWNDTNEPPWKAVQIRGHWRVTTDRGDPSDEYDVESSGDEEVARLQAAAPALLEACEALLACEVNPRSDRAKKDELTALLMIREATATAKGQP